MISVTSAVLSCSRFDACVEGRGPPLSQGLATPQGRILAASRGSGHRSLAALGGRRLLTVVPAGGRESLPRGAERPGLSQVSVRQHARRLSQALQQGRGGARGMGWRAAEQSLPYQPRQVEAPIDEIASLPPVSHPALLFHLWPVPGPPTFPPGVPTELSFPPDDIARAETHPCSL